MLVAIRTLTESNTAKRVGNHAVTISRDGCKHFIYHATEICTVDPVARNFTTDNGGWNTQSTNRAINDYRRYYTAMGYTEV